MKKLSHGIIGLVALVSLSASPLTSAVPAADLEAYHLEQEQLLEERREFAKTLSDLSPAERRAAIEAYQEERAERLAAHRALGEAIREATKEEHQNGEPSPERVVPEDRPIAEPPSAAIKQRIEEFKAARDDYNRQRSELLELLQEKTAEERKEALAELRERTIEQRRLLGATIRDTARESREERRE